MVSQALLSVCLVQEALGQAGVGVKMQGRSEENREGTVQQWHGYGGHTL